MTNPNPPKNRYPAKKKRPPKPNQTKPRATREEMERREMQVEQALLRRLPPQQIVRTLAAEWGIGTRPVWGYLQSVRARWAREAEHEQTAEGRAEARSHMRASLNDLYAKSLGRREVVRDSAGNPVIDPSTGRPATVEKPVVADALRAARLLMDLDALQAPPPVQAHSVQATVVAAVARAKPANLAAFLTRIPQPPAPKDEST